MSLASVSPLLQASLSPAALVILVTATYVLGTRYGTRVGVASALLVASSPIVVFARVNPAGDLLAAAALMTSVAAATGTKKRHARAAGLAAAAAIALRPGVVIAALPQAVFLLLRPERPWTQRWRAVLEYALPCVVALLVVVTLHVEAVLAAGAGAVAVSLPSFYLLPIALALATPFLLPGALTLLLIVSVAVDGAVLIGGVQSAPGVITLLTAAATTTVLAMAALDAAWRLCRLPRAAVAVVAAAALFVVVEYLG